MMSVCLNIKTWPLSTEESVPWPTKPSLVVIVLSLRTTMRESWKWTNAVPTNVTVIGLSSRVKSYKGGEAWSQAHLSLLPGLDSNQQHSG